MRIEGHFEKINSLEGTLSKLDDNEDHETIVELCMLISAHYINAALHYTGRLRPDKDIKHNKLPGVLKREEYFDENSIKISELFRELEEMRPSQVYGTGKNGNTAKRAKSIYSKIKKFCMEIMNV
ncbi:MAG TPA: hypothetical protein VHO92_00550 [Methanobacterium sp.]|nr:hypothetical protein [Methanobacterium sp.]